MMRFVYTFFMWAIQPLLRRKLLRRGRDEPGYLEAIDERFGHYSQPAQTHAELLWVHAVSLGETRAAAVLIEALRAQQPALRVLLTHGTATGRAQGQSILRAGDVQVWQPWDTPAGVRRFLSHFKPQAAVILETEVWPNWVAACQQAHIPMLLVNARMSAKSQHQAQRLAWLSQPAFAGYRCEGANRSGRTAFARFGCDGERCERQFEIRCQTRSACIGASFVVEKKGIAPSGDVEQFA